MASCRMSHVRRGLAPDFAEAPSEGLGGFGLGRVGFGVGVGLGFPPPVLAPPDRPLMQTGKPGSAGRSGGGLGWGWVGLGLGLGLGLGWGWVGLGWAGGLGGGGFGPKPGFLRSRGVWHPLQHRSFFPLTLARPPMLPACAKRRATARGTQGRVREQRARRGLTGSARRRRRLPRTSPGPGGGWSPSPRNAHRPSRGGGGPPGSRCWGTGSPGQMPPRTGCR